MYLVDDEYFVTPQLRRDARLLHQGLDVLHGIVGGGIELKDVQGALLIERLARLTGVAGFAIGSRILAIDRLGEDAGASGLSYTPRPAEQIGMGQLPALHGILQRRRQGCLPYDGVEGHRTVFSGRNDIFHKNQIKFCAKIQNKTQLSIHNSHLFCNFADKLQNMKVITSIKAFLLRVWHSMFFKYTVVCIAGVLIVGFLDENSVWSHLKNRQKISELEEETARYNAIYQRDQAQIREMDKNPKTMERIARERYFMKADDEDIFVLSDDDREAKPLSDNEAAQ